MPAMEDGAVAALVGAESLAAAERSREKPAARTDVTLTNATTGELSTNRPPHTFCRAVRGVARERVGSMILPVRAAMTPGRCIRTESRPRGPSDGSVTPPSDSDSTIAETKSTNGADAAAPAKRKRGRPRKYEDLTEEERKQRRAVDNRHAAKRSYYRRINKMTELEQVGCSRLAEKPFLSAPHPPRY